MHQSFSNLVVSRLTVILLVTFSLFICPMAWAQQQPVVDSFEAVPTSGWTPLEVNFTCTGHDPDGSIQSYILEPTGGGTYALQIENDTGLFSYKYYNIGTYSANCKAKDNSGTYSAPATASIDIYGANLYADYTSGSAPLTVSFTCTARTHDDPIQTYRIGYSDGSPIDENQTGFFSHTYTSEGRFEAICEATDSVGATTYANVIIDVSGFRPIVDSFTADPASGWFPLTVNFTCTAHDPDGEVDTYTFNPYNFNYFYYSVENTTGIFSFTYEYPNISYMLTSQPVCVAKDKTNEWSAVAYATVDVYGVYAYAYPTYGGVPIDVNFYCAAHLPDDPIQNYTIDYKDGSPIETSSWSSFTHTYTTPGTYLPVCTAKDSVGTEFTSEPLTLEFLTYAPVIDTFTADPTSGRAPLEVEFNCAAHDPDGVIESYVLDPIAAGSSAVTLENPTGAFSYTYQDKGSYRAVCKATDDLGVTKLSEIITINVELSAATAGVFRPIDGQIYLKKENTSGFADASLVYGIAGDLPITGDWDGDGVTGIGIYRDGQFFLKNTIATGYADMVIAFGQNGDLPVAGDWNGDGVDTIGIYRNGVFMLRNSNSTGAPDMIFALGTLGDTPLAGDWDGNGADSCGVFRPDNGLIFLKNENTSGYADVAITFGIPDDLAVMGDWDGDGIDTIGVYRNGAFLLRNSNETGWAEMMFWLGQDGDVPISGRWGLP